MNPETQTLIDEINRGFELSRVEWSYAPASLQLYPNSVRIEAEKYFRALGHEVKRRKAMSSGQRFDGLWVRRLST